MFFFLSFLVGTGIYLLSDNGGDDDIKMLKMKYKQSNNKVYHDFYKTKMCSLYNLVLDMFPILTWEEHLQKRKGLPIRSFRRRAQREARSP